MTDQEKKDLAIVYGTMTQLSAWKHFMHNVVDRIEAQAINDEDALPIENLNLGMVGECRGRRNAIRQIRARLDYIVNGLA